MKYDMIIAIDILRNLYPFTFDHTHIRFYYQSKSYSSPVKHWPSFLISNICEAKVGYCDDKFRDWFNQEKDKYNPELSTVQSQIMKHSSENPLAFWDREEYMITLPSVPDDNPTKASHPGMSLADTELCRQEIEDLLAKNLIEPSTSSWGCQAFYVNKHSKQKRGKKKMVINYKPLNQYLVPRKFPIPLKDDLLCRIPNATTFSKLDLKSGFCQFKIHPNHRYKTAFVVPQGQYQWISMPFGLKIAPFDCH